MKDYEDEAFEDIERAQGWRKRQIAEQGEPVAYQQLFDAIAAATKTPYEGAVGISVTAFEKAIGSKLYTTPQPKQEQGEPVVRDWRESPWGFGEKRLLTAQYSDIVSDGGLDPRNKFDTTPQQRKPLTIEQIRKHWQVAKVLDMTDAEIDFADYVLITRDVEALHGIKE